MSVRCAVCNTENRAAAMFCRGCAGKLPAFVATGPSALQTLASAPVARSRPRARPRLQRLPLETRAFWVTSGGIALAIGVAFTAWYAYVTRDASPARPASSAAAPAMAASDATRAARQPSAPSTPPVTPAASLATGEVIVAPGTPSGAASESSPATAPASASTSAAATAPTVPMAPPEPAPLSPPEDRRPTREATRRIAPLDPRQGCEHLNFIFAARCTANHCERAEYARHPRCDAVREERRRDEARRNPTLGY